jgi:hypothetical protein
VTGLALLLLRVPALRRPGPTRFPRALPAVLAAGLAIGLYFWQIPITRDLRMHVNVRAAGYLNGHLALAEHIAGHASTGDMIALMDIGIVGYHCINQHVLDVTGLTDRLIAKSPGPFLDKQFDLAYVFERRPRYIVIVLSAAAPLDQIESFEQFSCWTGIEGKLIDHPLFTERYVNLRPDDPALPPFDRLAAALGAEKVFQHDYPAREPYLLVLYHARETQAMTDDELFRAIRLGQMGFCPVCRDTHDASIRHAPSP